MMKQHCGFQKVLLLLFVSLLAVIAPISLFVSRFGERQYINDISSVIPIQSTNVLRLKSTEKDVVKEMHELGRLVRNDIGQSTDGSWNETSDAGDALLHMPPVSTGTLTVMQGIPNRPTSGKATPPSKTLPTPPDKMIREMKDQVIIASAFLHLSPAINNTRLVRELKHHIRITERILSHVNKDKDLPQSVLQEQKSMEKSLEKARSIFPKCATVATKLRAMAFNKEEQLEAQNDQVKFLIQLSTRTLPRGLHCLSLQLTSKYFELPRAERDPDSKKRLEQPNLYHYAIFSNNVLACAVVVNSTISSSLDPEKIVFHIVTDDLNYPAITMWFLNHPPDRAAIEIVNMYDFKWLPSGYISIVKQLGLNDPRYSSVLNHLRFYLPQIFPNLDKILFLDHDVVVQRDLSEFWKSDLNGKVNGAVEMCKNGEPFYRLRDFVDFTNRVLTKSFDPRACIWGFGMNIFDLQQWRRLGLTSVYMMWMQQMKLMEGKENPVLRAGTLPLGQLTFYNHTLALNRRWHVFGLGFDPDVSRTDIEKAAVIHYDGNMKPWLDINIPKYKKYWNKYLNFNHRYLQQCNIHE